MGELVDLRLDEELQQSGVHLSSLGVALQDIERFVGGDGLFVRPIARCQGVENCPQSSSYESEEGFRLPSG